MKSPLNVALVGLGQIARSKYVPALQKSKEFQLVGLCSRTPESCKQLSELTGVEKWTTDYTTLVSDKNIDAIIVLTPHPRHAEVACAALAAGKHILIEKPLATSLEDALAIAKASEGSGAIVMALPFDESAEFLTVVDIVRKGLLGKVVGIRAIADAVGPPEGCDWKYNVKDAGGGALLAKGVYGLSKIAGLMGPPVAVSAHVSTALKHRTLKSGRIIDSDIDDQSSLQLTYETGQLVTVETRWTADGGFGFLQVIGREGSVLLMNNNKIFLRGKGKSSKGEQLKQRLRLRLSKMIGIPPFAQGYENVKPYVAKQNMLENFAHCIRSGKVPTANIYQAVSVTEQITKACESSKRENVQIPLVHKFEPWTKLPQELFDLSCDRLGGKDA